mgnify:CR=1 FL=1
MTQPTPPLWYSDHVTTIYLTHCKEDELTVRIISSGPGPGDPVLAYIPVTWGEDEANADLIRSAGNFYRELICLIQERFEGLKSEEDWHRRAKEILARARLQP